MSMWRHDSAKIARKEVALWFATTPTGTVFLPGDGRVLPLGIEEAKAIRASAETKAVEWQAAFQSQLMVAIFIVVAIVMVSQTLAAKLPDPFGEAVRTAAFVLYAAHGGWAIYEAFAVMKKMRTLRASIALALAGRVPLDPSRAGSLGARNPIPAIVIAIVSGLLIGNWSGEILSHVGVDLIGWIPMWLPMSLVVFVYIVVLGNRWIDRSRGVGVLPPEDLASRVRNRLDRERLGL